MIRSPQYSLLQFSTSDPFKLENNAPKRLCFLVGDVIIFQIIGDAPLQIHSIRLYDGNSNYPIGGSLVTDLGSNIYQIRLNTIADNLGCFSIMIEEIVSEAVFLSHFSQKIEIIPANHPIANFTQLLRYWNDYQAYGFSYSNEFANQIRIPFNIHSYQPKIEQSIYRQTDGNIQKMKAIKQKEYKVETIGNEAFHECIAVALMHEHIEVVSGKRQGKYITEAEYEIAWDEVDRMGYNVLVKAETQILLDEYAVANPLYGFPIEISGSGSSDSSSGGGSNSSSGGGFSFSDNTSS